MIFVVIPAYNEEENIGVLLDRTLKVMELNNLKYSVIIVNDGSTDNTLEICKSKTNTMPIFIINHEKNLGLAQTELDGLKQAVRIAGENDIIVRFDGDNSFSPEQIPEMVNKINDGAELVIASRYLPGSKTSGIPLHRMILSYGASLLLKIFSPVKGVTDYSCGFRAYKVSLVKRAFEVYGDNLIEKNGFSVTPAILLKFAKLTDKIAEIPVELRYDLKKGKSKMKIIKTILGYFKLLYKMYKMKTSFNCNKTFGE